MNDPIQQKAPEPIATRENILNQQVGVCLGIVATLRPFLLQDDFQDNSVLPKSLDGGYNAAATATFVQACDRLDKLLAEGKNWGLEAHDKIYTSLHETQEAAYKNFVAQTQAAEELRRPSRTFKPEFAETGKKTFIAYSGDPTITGGLLIGHGATPAAALDDYDAAFNRPPEQQVRINAEGKAKLFGRVLPDTVAAPEEIIDTRGRFRKFVSRLFRHGHLPVRPIGVR